MSVETMYTTGRIGERNNATQCGGSSLRQRRSPLLLPPSQDRPAPKERQSSNSSIVNSESRSSFDYPTPCGLTPAERERTTEICQATFFGAGGVASRRPVAVGQQPKLYLLLPPLPLPAVPPSGQGGSGLPPHRSRSGLGTYSHVAPGLQGAAAARFDDRAAPLDKKALISKMISKRPQTVHSVTIWGHFWLQRV